MGNRIKRDVLQRMVEFVKQNSECKLISQEFYIDDKKKLEFQCECGNNFITTFEKFKHREKRQCNPCGRKRRADQDRLTIEEIKNFIEVESKSGCKLLSNNYQNYKTFMDIKCPCGNVFSTNYANFKTFDKRTCDECTKKTRKYYRQYSYEEIKNYVETESDCKLLSKTYKNSREPLQLLCGSCNTIFEMTFDIFRQSSKKQCTPCTKKENGALSSFSYEEVFDFVEKNSNCILLSKEYERNSDKLQFQCSCGTIFETSFATFKRAYKRRCNKCSKSMSHSEVKIQDYLVKRDIKFIPQYYFPDCKDKSFLKFDFAILSEKDELLFLIEYDGEQHFIPVEFFGGEDNLKAIKKRDNIKNEYCKNNGIRLERITYKEDLYERLNQIFN